MPGSRRFPPPWRVEETSEAFCIFDGNGQALAYVISRKSLGGGPR